MKELMKKAHQITKEIKAEYPEVNYSAQLSICMSYLLKKGEKEMKKSITLEGKNSMGIMVNLKEHFGAWLIIKDSYVEDYNCVETVNYLVFTENNIVIVDADGDCKKLKENELFLYYTSLEDAYNKLQDDRKNKIEGYLNTASKQRERFYKSLAM